MSNEAIKKTIAEEYKYGFELILKVSEHQKV